MHPDYRSDHPGDCPICGMALEAVRAGAATGGDVAARALPHGAVQVSPERQQAIGVRLGVVNRLAGHPAAADDRARGARREPDLSDRRRRERLDPQRGERDDGRRREKGPGARVVRRAGGRVQECAAVVLHRPRSVLPHGRHAAAAAATVGSRTPPCAARRSTGWPTCCATWAYPTRSSGKWASAAISCRTSASSRRWTASC